MTTPKRARVYARISDDTEGRALGVQRQIEDARALGRRLGWTIGGEVIVDNDISASTRSKAKRPGFEQLLHLIREGECDGVLYYSTSRLTRRPAEYETVIQLVEEFGVKLATVASGSVDLSTADGRMIGRMLAAQDAAEAERIGERVARAFVQRRASGRPNPCSRAYGFATGGDSIIEEEAETIRLGCQMILDGASLREVGAEWARLGHLPITAKRWSGITVKRAITNPRVSGMVAHGGIVLARGIGPAIIEEETRLAVLDRLRGRAATYQRGAFSGRAEHLLAGFLLCGRCGSKMKVNALRTTEGALRPDSFLICPLPQGGCGLKRNLRYTQAYIETVIEERLAQVGPRGADDAPRAEQTVAQIEEERERLRAQITQTRELFTSGVLGSGDFVATLRILNEKIEAASVELDARRGQIQPASGDLGAVWREGDLDARRRVMAALVESIVIMPIGRVGPKRALEMIGPETIVIALKS